MRKCDKCGADLSLIRAGDYSVCQACGKRWKEIESDFSEAPLKLESNITRSLMGKEAVSKDNKPLRENKRPSLLKKAPLTQKIPPEKKAPELKRVYQVKKYPEVNDVFKVKEVPAIKDVFLDGGLYPEQRMGRRKKSLPEKPVKRRRQRKTSFWGNGFGELRPVSDANSGKRQLKIILSFLLGIMSAPVFFAILYCSIQMMEWQNIILMIIAIPVFFIYLFYDALYGKT